jgi:uncharacterized protein (TIGR02001 family)
MTNTSKLAALCGAVGLALIAISGTAAADGYEVAKPAAAEESRKFTYSFTLTGTSDYIFRGVSLTDNDPTVQGSINIGYGIFYAGIWSSGLDWSSDPNAEVEIDYYAGFKPTWGKATFDFGVLYYTYPGTNDVLIAPLTDPVTRDGTSVLELKASVSGELLPKLTGTANYFYSPDYNSYKYSVFEGILAYALPKTWVFDPIVSGTIGYQDSYNGHLPDYTYWNAGLALVVEKLTFDFRYWDTDLSGGATGDCFNFYYGGQTCSERFVFSATVALP